MKSSWRRAGLTIETTSLLSDEDDISQIIPKLNNTEMRTDLECLDLNLSASNN
jgi:hypothetical protein